MQLHGSLGKMLLLPHCHCPLPDVPPERIDVGSVTKALGPLFPNRMNTSAFFLKDAYFQPPPSYLTMLISPATKPQTAAEKSSPFRKSG